MLLILHLAWFWRKMPKRKREGAGFLLRCEKQNLHKWYSEGSAAYGAVKNLTKASKLPVSKKQYFLLSKFSYRTIMQATRKFRRMRSFARFKNEIWCMYLAFVDKLAKYNNGVIKLRVHQDMFDRMVDAKGMKTKDSKETVKFFPKRLQKKNRPEKFWVDQGTELTGHFKKFCVAEGKHVYSTMSETKATFAERTIRSLKNIFYRFKEEHGYNYIHKLSQLFKILSSRKTRMINMVPNKVKISDFMSIL